MLQVVHGRVTPRITFARIYLYTRVKTVDSISIYARAKGARSTRGWGMRFAEVANKKNTPTPTQSSLPFGAGAQLSRDSFRAFNHRIKLREKGGRSCEQSRVERGNVRSQDNVPWLLLSPETSVLAMIVHVNVAFFISIVCFISLPPGGGEFHIRSEVLVLPFRG